MILGRLSFAAPPPTTQEVNKKIGSDKCSAGSAQAAQPQKERVTMNAQIRRGLVEIARPLASELQVLAEEYQFGGAYGCDVKPDRELRIILGTMWRGRNTTE